MKPCLLGSFLLISYDIRGAGRAEYLGDDAAKRLTSVTKSFQCIYRYDSVLGAICFCLIAPTPGQGSFMVQK